MVLAIAPSQVIPRDLCGGSANYISKGHDIVPYLGAGLGRGFLLNELMLIHRELIHLEKHKRAPWFDHSFSSPTFAEKIEDTVSKFVGTYGE
jgi:hypothetical protein